MFKRGFVSIVVLVATLSGAFAQTGTWSGKLDVQGTPLTIVFHLDDDNPTADSPDQGVKGIPIQIERTGFGIISIRIPSLIVDITVHRYFLPIQMEARNWQGCFKNRWQQLPPIITGASNQRTRYT